LNSSFPSFFKESPEKLKDHHEIVENTKSKEYRFLKNFLLSYFSRFRGKNDFFRNLLSP